MPSTGWNVFVASVVALVVYIAVRAEMVLLGLIAGTLTFVVGWLLGYAINQDLLDSMELSRVVGAAGVTVFAIVWTLLYSQQEYLLGLIVVCLSWFAAWFTSSMGPIKGDTGAMATIDEPRPPASSEPEGPLDLGGPDEPPDSGGGFLGRLFGFGDGTTDPRGYPADEAAPGADERDEPAASADRARAHSEADPTPTTDTGSSAESIFGLGIFYEGDPTEPSAGAEDDGPVATDEPAPSEETEPSRSRSPDGVSTDPPAQGAEPAATDPTRPSATGPVHRDAGDEDHGGTSDHPPIDEAALDPPAEGTDGDSEGASGENLSRSGETPSRSRGTEDAEAASETYNTYRGTTDSDDTETPDRTTEAEDDADEPPEDHRVDVDDDGFIFG